MSCLPSGSNTHSCEEIVSVVHHRLELSRGLCSKTFDANAHHHRSVCNPNLCDHSQISFQEFCCFYYLFGFHRKSAMDFRLFYCLYQPSALNSHCRQFNTILLSLFSESVSFGVVHSSYLNLCWKLRRSTGAGGEGGFGTISIQFLGGHLCPEARTIAVDCPLLASSVLCALRLRSSSSPLPKENASRCCALPESALFASERGKQYPQHGIRHNKCTPVPHASDATLHPIAPLFKQYSVPTEKTRQETRSVEAETARCMYFTRARTNRGTL